MPNLVASLAPAGTFTAGGTGTISAGSMGFGTNADRAVAVLVVSASADTAAIVSSVVVGGVTLTAGANIDISNEYSYANSKGRLFTGTGIPSGSQSVSINWANPNFVGHHVGYAGLAFDDAATLTVTDANASATSGTAPTITLTSASGDLMAAFGAWQPDVRATVTAPSAEQFDGLATAQTGTFYGETQTAASSSTTLAATAASSTGGWRMWGLRVEGAAAAPVITGPSGAAGASTSAKNVAEGGTAVHTFTADVAVAWSKNGGADQALFTINSSTGALAFSSAPDYETPGDADTNNTYVVVVRATATTGGATADQTVTVTVTDVAEGGPDTTPPTLTGSIAITGLTSTGYTATCPVATDNVAVTGYQWRLGGSGAYTDIAAAGRAFTFTGRTPSTTDSLEMRAKDAAGNFSTALSTTVDLPAATDTTAPTLTGVVTPSGVGSTTATISWPAGADNVAVVGYDYRLNGGSYISLGNVLTYGLSSLTPSTGYTCDVRARDAAGNVSTPVISGSFTTSAPGTYNALVGPFAANTGSLPRAQGEAFDWWAAHNVYIGGDWDAATRLSGSGTLDANGQAAIDLTAVGFWEVQIRFPDDTDTEAEKGTARQTVTVA